MTTESAADSLERLRSRAHPNCVVCGQSNTHGLRLNFACCDDGSVRASFYCDRSLQGYSGYLHGGVISSLLDGAMANCLFAHGSMAVTAELNVRFLGPVLTGRPVVVRAWIRDTPPLFHILQGEIVQQGEIKATAVGKFMRPSVPRKQ